MSWIDKINTELTITTGDDKVYTPEWLNAEYVVEYNLAEFVFKDLPGTLIKRGEQRGEVYDVEFYFQGADHLEVADAFKKSAANKKPWTVYHPFYGSLYVQPAGLRFNNRELNVTKITGVIIQTLKDDGTQVPQDAPEVIAAAAEVVNTTMTEEYAEEVPLMDVSNLQTLSANIDGAYAAVTARLNSVQSYATEYTNKYNAAVGVLNTATYDTLEIIGQAANLLSAPFDFADSVVNRIEMFGVQIELLNRNVAAILGLVNRPTKTLKRLYEVNAGITMASMCRATVTNVVNDYNYRPAVLATIRSVVSYYNGYLLNLNTLQSENGGGLDSYIPNADSLIKLSQLVNLTIATLYSYTADAKQERVYLVPYDTNILAVTDELYGMLEDDSTLYALMESNNIELEELLIIKQGRELIYYV